MQELAKKRKRFLVWTTVAVSIAVAFVLASGLISDVLPPFSGSVTNHSSTVNRNLPKECSKPSNGYLIIASDEGFNDSILHGAPKVSWPMIRVQKGAAIDIVVCNTDVQAHGFQIRHYYDSNIVTVRPGQVIHVSFFANEVGTFEMYCSIFCTIHVFMQNAQLIVSG